MVAWCPKDLLWCHICVGVKVVFSNNKDFGVWPLHALLSLYVLGHNEWLSNISTLRFSPTVLHTHILTVVIGICKFNTNLQLSTKCVYTPQVPCARLIEVGDDMRRFKPEFDGLVEDKLQEFVQDYVNGKIKVTCTHTRARTHTDIHTHTPDLETWKESHHKGRCPCAQVADWVLVKQRLVTWISCHSLVSENICWRMKNFKHWNSSVVAWALHLRTSVHKHNCGKTTVQKIDVIKFVRNEHLA